MIRPANPDNPRKEASMEPGGRPATRDGRDRRTSALLLFDAVETARHAALFVALVGCGVLVLVALVGGP
jgi:hypothetical protein